VDRVHILPIASSNVSQNFKTVIATWLVCIDKVRGYFLEHGVCAWMALSLGFEFTREVNCEFLFEVGYSI